jgi:hypothetical protein
MGVQVSTLDAEIKKLRGPGDGAELSGQAVEFEDMEQYPGDVVGHDVLDEALARLMRHMHMDYHEAAICVLWVAHTHVFNLFSHTPRLIIDAPESECGKTVLLHHMLGSWVNKRLTADNVSPAVYFRIIEAQKPTFMIDEVDSWLKQDNDLLGSLKSGFEPQGVVLRCEGDAHAVRQYSVYAPVAMAGIQISQKLPKPVVNRGMIITLERAKDEVAEADAFKRKKHAPGIKTIGAKLAKWVRGAEQQIAATDPQLPDGMINRDEDKWLPMFTLAEVADGDWPARIMQAYTRSIHTHEPSKSELFLMDVKAVMPEMGNIHTADLIIDLCGLEDSRYIEYNFKAYEAEKKKIQPVQIARLLKKYKVQAKDVRMGTSVKRGYSGDELRKVFARYIPVLRAKLGDSDFTRYTATTAAGGGFSSDEAATASDSVAAGKPSQAAPHNDCSGVAPKNAQPSQEEKKDHLSEADDAEEVVTHETNSGIEEPSGTVLLPTLKEKGVSLSIDGDELMWSLASGQPDDATRKWFSDHKQQIIAELQSRDGA